MSAYLSIVLLSFLGLMAVAAVVKGEEECTVDWQESSKLFRTTTEMCEHGCCGTAEDKDRQCCTDSHKTTYIVVGCSCGGGFLMITLIVVAMMKK